MIDNLNKISHSDTNIVVASALRDPAWHERLAWSSLFILVLLPALWLTEFKPWQLWDAQSLKATGQFLATFVPPAHDPVFLQLAVVGTWKTIAIATTGVAMAWLVALPAALIATRALSRSALSLAAPAPMRTLARITRSAVRGVLLVLRSVPELVWGLLFVRAVGLGDPAGVMAIFLTFTGMMGKVFIEIFESVDPRPTQALMAQGAGRLQAFCYALLPQALPELLSYTVFRWECAIRSSVILGFVGAGGLGQLMDQSMKMMNGAEAMTILLAFIALVGVADVLSKALRKAVQ